MHRRALDREAKLKAEVTGSRPASLREQQLFGRKTETTAATESPAPLTTPTGPAASAPRSAAWQAGPKRGLILNFRRSPRIMLPPDQCRCSRCGQPFVDFPGTEDSKSWRSRSGPIAESSAVAVIGRPALWCPSRRRHRPAAAPIGHQEPPGGLDLGGGPLGQIFVLSANLSAAGRLGNARPEPVAGHVTDGLRRLDPLFEPVYKTLVERSQGQTLWHADETRWLVFASIEGKVGYRWYLWVFHSPKWWSSCWPRAGRTTCPRSISGRWRAGILVVDRYKAYQAVDKVKSGLIVLAFCWAHVRRDFLTCGEELAGTRSMGVGLGGTDWRVVPTQ